MKETTARLEALRHYRRDSNTRLNEFKATPTHDWAEHGAFAFRYLAVRHKTPEEPRPSSMATRIGCRQNTLEGRFIDKRVHADTRLGRPPRSESCSRHNPAGPLRRRPVWAFSISISNGERGMTVRFDSEVECRTFFDRGAVERR